jgi:hypothetical protein
MRENELTSVLLAAGTLVLVLLGSLVLAATYLMDDGGRAVTATEAHLPRCRLADECRMASAELRRAYPDAQACDGAGARVCLVPMGDVPKDLVDAIVAHYRNEYGLPILVARPLDLRPGFDRRSQLEESLVHRYMYDAYREYAVDRSVTLIGILPVDLYLADQSWEWGFGRLRGEPRAGVPGAIDYRQGIISIYRMDPRNWGQPADDSLRDDRVMKMLSKYIALAYYDLPLSSDPTSVTYSNITGLGDLDRVSERIPVP